MPFMAENETDGRLDNRADFFRRCAEYVDGTQAGQQFTLAPGKKPSARNSSKEQRPSGASWPLACLENFLGSGKELGDVALSAVKSGTGVRTSDTVTFTLGLRNEFTQDMTPAYALRLLAFFENAKEDSAVKNVGLKARFDFNRGRNWQLNLCKEVCTLKRDTRQISSLQEVPNEWEKAFELVAAALQQQERVLSDLVKSPRLVCTENVWKQLLRWYHSNASGDDQKDLFAELPFGLVNLKVDELSSEDMPNILYFLKEQFSEKPVGDVRKIVDNNRKNFQEWLKKEKTNNGRELHQSTREAYFSELNNVTRHCADILYKYNVSSVFAINSLKTCEECFEEIKQTDWYKKKNSRDKGNEHGESNIGTALNKYLNFLNKKLPPDTTMSEKSETNIEGSEMELSLAELLQRPDREELLTGSKPIYVDCPWGRIEENVWRSLYKLIWEKAWKENRDELVRAGSLVTPTNAEAYLRNTKFYFLVDEKHSVYNHYGIRNMMPLVGKLFVACGIALDDVKVRFVTNVETDSTAETDADLNTILYGPPGTGKTYHTKAYAVAICTGSHVAEVMAWGEQKIKEKYDAMVQERRIAFATFHQSYEYGDFIEGIRPEEKGGVVTYSVDPGVFRKFCDEAGDEPCVFIIDEINRGNISKILGELITLIEPSKRETQHVTLPLSGDDFTVPKNVYILGTMNTADRSLAMMDTALRRRFDFVQMAPQPELLPDNVAGVNVQGMLRTMNERICWLYDAEHTLGHALFWSLYDEGKCTLFELERIFRKKIIPLLQEYFHDDYRKVQLVLGKSPMIERIDKPSNGLFPGADEIDLPESIYRVAEEQAVWGNPNTYKKIYQEVTDPHAQG